MSQYFVIEVARVAQKASGDVVGVFEARIGVIYDAALLEFEFTALSLDVKLRD